MLYLHDVWVNWFINEEHGYNVCHYHEWRKNDHIELIEQMPVLYVTEALYHYMENRLHELPRALLQKIENKTYYRTGHQRELIKYACIVTDGRGVLAIHTNEHTVPMKKSRLTPKQTQRVLRLTKRQRQLHINVPHSHDTEDKQSIAFQAEIMYGLTRRERQLKRLLMIAMYQLKHANNSDEIIYWCTEWDRTKSFSLNKQSVEQMWHELMNEIKYGWSKAHETFCEQIVKRHPMLEKYWQREQQLNENIPK